MDKNFKSSTEHSSVRLTEDNNLSENNSAVASNSESQETTSTLLSAVDDSPNGSSSTKSSSKSVVDRCFDQFGLWTLTLVASFLVSGLALPLSFLTDTTIAAYPYFVLILGAISSCACAIAGFAWFFLGRCNMTSSLRFTISLWLPTLFAQLLQMIPTGMMTPAKSFGDYIFYVVVCLIMPSLMGSSFALIAHHLRSKIFRDEKVI